MSDTANRLRERQALDAVLRTDFGSFTRKVFHTLVPGEAFVPGWYIDAIVHRLEQVRRGQIRRLIINMPPRSLKSIAASVAFPPLCCATILQQRSSASATEGTCRKSIPTTPG